MPTVRRIAKRAEIRVVRCHNGNAPAWRKQPVDLFHGPDHIRNVFNDMDSSNLAERAVVEREREMIEISDDVSLRIRVAIDADGARIFVNPAANVEDQCSRIRRQASSVSTAKSA